MTHSARHDTNPTNARGSSSAARRRLPLAALQRLALALLGAYAFTWGFVALGIAGLVALGVDFHEAETALLVIAFLIFLPMFLWAFSATRQAHVWTVLGGGVVLMAAAAGVLQQMILS